MRKFGFALVLISAAPAVAILPPPPSEEGRPAEAWVCQGRAPGADRESRSFSVQGADLRSRHETALLHARSRVQPGVWIAYSIEAAPEVDAEILAVSVGRQGFCGTQLAGGRRALVLLRYAAGRDLPDDVELCQIERPREDEARATYWLGRATLSESFDFLEKLTKSAALEATADGLVRALRLHESARAIPKLRELARRSPLPDVRAKAAVGLAALPKQSTFLASLVLDDRQGKAVRARVALSLGESRDPDAVNLVRELSALVSEPSVQRGLTDALARLVAGAPELRPVTTSSLIGAFPSHLGGTSSQARGITQVRR